MTAKAAATQGQITRALKAAKSAGLIVRGIAPDGTVLVANDNDPTTIEPGLDAELAAFEAKHGTG